MPPWVSPQLRSGGQNQKWPTSGRGGYITPAVCGVPTGSEGVGQNHRWATSGQGGYKNPAVWGGPPLHSRGQNQK